MAWTRPLAFLKQLRRMAGPTRLGGDAALVCLVAVMAFLLLRHADRVNPLEGAALAGLAAALAMAARHWWAWQERLGAHGGLWAWAHRVVTLGGYPEIPAGAEPTLARALGQLLQDLRGREAELQRLRLDLCREWREVEGLLATADQARAADQAHREQRAERLEHLGRELRALVEQVLKLDQFEMSHRLQSDQHRLQGQAFRAITSQVRDGLERFEELLGELQDSFPRLRREEEALTRLADAGARQASRLGLSVRGLVAHTPRLVEETQARLLRAAGERI